MRYFPSGVYSTMFQWSLSVVKYDVGVETRPSYEILLPPNVICTLWVLFFWGLMLHTMRMYATFLPFGTSCLWIKSMCWYHKYLGFLGSGVQSHLQMLFFILVCRAPSLGACTLVVFLSLGILPHSSGLDVLSHSCCLVGLCPVFSCFLDWVYRDCYVGWI